MNQSKCLSVKSFLQYLDMKRKQAFCGMSEMEFGKALEYTNETFVALCVTDDAREGVDAFLKNGNRSGKKTGPSQPLNLQV